MPKESYYLGVDVGTGSARSAIIDSTGQVVSLDVEPILTVNPEHDIYEQSTDNIWKSICKTVRTVLSQSKLAPESIKGVGFDATCSLVVLNKENQPCSIDPVSNYTRDELNVILWADHRAIDQAARINATKHDVLRYVGNTISPEMEIPKTLWLKENLPQDKWDAIGQLMDLPDFLSFRATGSAVRSTCSLTCKCSFLPKWVGQGWEPSYFKEIGLGCLIDDNFDILGGVGDGEVLYAGEPIGNGLTQEAATELGLLPGTPVGSSCIDAYAGAIATLGATSSDTERNEMLGSLKDSLIKQGPSRLAIICGTSSCHITMSSEPIFVPGVWGPYRSVMVPDMWCAEGGQSSTGQLIDFIVNTHPALEETKRLAAEKNQNIYTFLTEHLNNVLKDRKGVSQVQDLTRDLHIYPDFHGNRSPLADPSLRGTIVGVSLDKSVDDLALRYLATLQAIACQTRHIIESLNQQGYTIDTLCISGGLCKSQLFVQTVADVSQCRVIMPESIEGAVVIGASFLGAKASGLSTDLWEIMVRLGRAGSTVLPNTDKDTLHFYNQKYKVFHAMLEDQKKYRRMMNNEE